MNVNEAATQRRTIRKFKQQPVERKLLEKYVDAARLAPTASNMQPLKFMIVDNPHKAAAVFEHVKWAGYIAPAGNPKEGERPVAFIVILADTEIKKAGYELDAGAAAQSIFLTAWEDGVGTCWMGAIDRDKIREVLSIPERYVINTVVALGYMAEHPVAEDISAQGVLKDSVKYYKDGQGVLHVPKRTLKEVLVEYT
jgi:nitroreductase